MKTQVWRRGALLLGFASVVLLIVGNELTKIGGDSPALHASAAQYREAVGAPGAGLLGVYLVVLAWLAFAGFFAAVAERLGAQGAHAGGARLIGTSAALAAAVGIAGASPLLAAMVLSEDGDLTPQIAKALLLMNAISFVVSWLTAALPLGICAACMVREQVRPGLGRVGLVVAPTLAVASLAVWRYEGAMLVWMLALLWIMAASVGLARSGEHAARDKATVRGAETVRRRRTSAAPTR